jgi:hypothetical protein
VGKQYKASLLPSLYIIDRKGKVAYRQAGVNPADETNLPKLVADIAKR